MSTRVSYLGGGEMDALDLAEISINEPELLGFMDLDGTSPFEAEKNATEGTGFRGLSKSDADSKGYTAMMQRAFPEVPQPDCRNEAGMRFFVNPQWRNWIIMLIDANHDGCGSDERFGFETFSPGLARAGITIPTSNIPEATALFIKITSGECHWLFDVEDAALAPDAYFLQAIQNGYYSGQWTDKKSGAIYTKESPAGPQYRMGRIQVPNPTENPHTAADLVAYQNPPQTSQTGQTGSGTSGTTYGQQLTQQLATSGQQVTNYGVQAATGGVQQGVGYGVQQGVSQITGQPIPYGQPGYVQPQYGQPGMNQFGLPQYGQPQQSSSSGLLYGMLALGAAGVGFLLIRKLRRRKAATVLQGLELAMDLARDKKGRFSRRRSR